MRDILVEKGCDGNGQRSADEIENQMQGGRPACVDGGSNAAEQSGYTRADICTDNNGVDASEVCDGPRKGSILRLDRPPEPNH